MRLALLLIATGLLAACGRPDVVAEEERNAAALPEPVTRSSPSPTGGPPANNVVTPATEAARTAIPRVLHGRWGLTPGDCTSTRGDAKGLLEIGADALRFYESRAVPAAKVQRSAESISGDFAFTGEGQRWIKHVTLELRDGKLVRTERDPLATFRYVRC